MKRNSSPLRREISVRQRVSILLIGVMLLLALWMQIQLVLIRPLPGSSVAGDLIVFGMLSIILLAIHIGIGYSVLKGSLLSRMLGTLLGASASLFWFTQASGLSIPAILIALSLVLVSWLPDR